MTDTLQRITGQFPQTPNLPVTLIDGVTNNGGWSRGQQSIVPITAQPTITNPWTIVGWSITYEMLLSASAVGLLAGLMGKLYGGLILGGSVTPTGPGTARYFNAQSLPSDPTTVAQMWDGATDASPPLMTATVSFVGPQNVNTYSMQLPVPLLMAPSDKLGMGLWLTPSLAAPVNDNGGYSIAVTASYAIEYTA